MRAIVPNCRKRSGGLAVASRISPAYRSGYTRSGAQGRCMAWHAVSAGILALASGCCTGGTSNPRVPTSHLIAGLDIPETDLVDIRWMEGNWRRALESRELCLITREVPGVYLQQMTGENKSAKSTLTVFRVGQLNFCQIDATGSIGTERKQVLIAVVNGYSERLSLDVVPAVFPAVWRDSRLLAALRVEDLPEVPVPMRPHALTILASWINEMGTFMQQDLTYYRPREE